MVDSGCYIYVTEVSWNNADDSAKADPESLPHLIVGTKDEWNDNKYILIPRNNLWQGMEYTIFISENAANGIQQPQQPANNFTRTQQQFAAQKARADAAQSSLQQALNNLDAANTVKTELQAAVQASKNLTRTQQQFNQQVARANAAQDSVALLQAAAQASKDLTRTQQQYVTQKQRATSQGQRADTAQQRVAQLQASLATKAKD